MNIDKVSGPSPSTASLPQAAENPSRSKAFDLRAGSQDSAASGTIPVGPREDGDVQGRVLNITTVTPGGEPGPTRVALEEGFVNFELRYGQLQEQVRTLGSNREMSFHDLLALQIQAQQISFNIQMVSKSVEHGVSGMKSVLQTHV